MFENLFGSINKERILFFIKARGEGYAREIAKFYNTDLSPIQNQLSRLERGNVLYTKKVGRTVIYLFNPGYPFYDEFNALIEKGMTFLPDEEQDRLLKVRKRPRRKGKPL